MPFRLSILLRRASPRGVRRAAPGSRWSGCGRHRRRRRRHARPAPDGFADLAAKLLPSVVNISTTQTLKTAGGDRGSPRCRNSRRARRSRNSSRISSNATCPRARDIPSITPRKATSLGSGFIIDPVGLHRHQQPRHRRCRRDHRHPARQHQSEGGGGRPRHQDRCRGAQGQDRQAARPRSTGATATRRASAIGCWRSATRSGSAAASPPASCRRGSATSIPAPTTIFCRPTPRSTAAIPAGRCSTWTAR